MLFRSIGPNGAGKTTLLKKMTAMLAGDDISICQPMTIERKRLTAGGICDAIIMDLSSEKPRLGLEKKARQVGRILKEVYQQNKKVVLVIDEAHMLHQNTLRALKRFYEYELGFLRLLGIILIGQVELKVHLGDYSMREVSNRCRLMELKKLTSGEVKGYLEHKFRRIRRKVEQVFSKDGLEAIASKAPYPLAVNNLAAKAMNEACELGEDLVTKAIVVEC